MKAVIIAQCISLIIAGIIIILVALENKRLRSRTPYQHRKLVGKLTNIDERPSGLYATGFLNEEGKKLFLEMQGTRMSLNNGPIEPYIPPDEDIEVDSDYYDKD
jgi:hypothetical protein